jgi:hypothetical protein
MVSLGKLVVKGCIGGCRLPIDKAAVFRKTISPTRFLHPICSYLMRFKSKRIMFKIRVTDAVP